MEQKNAIIMALIVLVAIMGIYAIYRPGTEEPTTGSGGGINFELLGQRYQFAAVGIATTCSTDADCVTKIGYSSAKCSNNFCIVPTIGNIWASHWVTNNYNVPVQVKISGDVTCTSSGKPNIILAMPNKNVLYTIAAGAQKKDTAWDSAKFDINTYANTNLAVDALTTFVCTVPVDGSYVLDGTTYSIPTATISYTLMARKDIAGGLLVGGGLGIGTGSTTTGGTTTTLAGTTTTAQSTTTLAGGTTTTKAATTTTAGATTTTLGTTLDCTYYANLNGIPFYSQVPSGYTCASYGAMPSGVFCYANCVKI